VTGAEKSQKFRKLQIDNLYIITQAIAALVVAKTVAVAVFFFLLIQKVESQKTYHYRRLYIYVGTAHPEFQRVPFGRVIGPALPEVVPIHNLNFDIDGTLVHELCGNIQDGEFCFRVRPVKFSGDKFKVDDFVVAFEKKRRVDEGYQKRFAPLPGKKIPHEPVVEPIDSFIAYINNLERNVVVEHDSGIPLPPRQIYYIIQA
jgi:hypothetical protein